MRQGMSPRRREWSEKEQAAFIASLDAILGVLKWRHVAERLGVTTSTLTRWRSGGSQPSREHEDAVHNLADKVRKLTG